MRNAVVARAPCCRYQPRIMSSALIMVAISIVAAAPILLAWRRSSISGRVMVGYGLLAVGVVAYHITFEGRHELASTDMSGIKAAGVGAPVECNEMMQLLDRAGVILDRSNPVRVVVNQAQWNQLPQEAQAVVVTCIESGRSPDDARGPVQIVNAR